MEKTVSEQTRLWREEEGVIYLNFDMASDGTTGLQWIDRFERGGNWVAECAKSVLRSPDFKPTKGVTTKVAIIKGVLCEANERIMKRISDEANRRKFMKLNADICCLLREKLTDEHLKAMGLCWVIGMHEPINDLDGNPSFLTASRSDGGRLLFAFHGEPNYRWVAEYGFAYAASLNF